MPSRIDIVVKVLTPEECERIIANLDECLALFERSAGLNGLEIRLKTLLKLVRDEIPRRARAAQEDPLAK